MCPSHWNIVYSVFKDLQVSSLPPIFTTLHTNSHTVSAYFSDITFRRIGLFARTDKMRYDLSEQIPTYSVSTRTLQMHVVILSQYAHSWQQQLLEIWPCSLTQICVTTSWWVKILKRYSITTFLLVRAALTHWGRVANICIGDLDNGLLPVWCQAIIWTNAGILLIGPLQTNFREILIDILTFSFRKRHLEVLSVKWRPFCLDLNVSTPSMMNSIQSNTLIYSHLKCNLCKNWKIKREVLHHKENIDTMPITCLTSTAAFLSTSYLDISQCPDIMLNAMPHKTKD